MTLADTLELEAPAGGRQAASSGGADRDVYRYTVGHGIDTFVGGEADDEIIVCGRSGSPTAFLVEDAPTYNARTRSRVGPEMVMISVNGALFMSAARVARITVEAGDGGDTMTVSGDFAAAGLPAEAIRFIGKDGNPSPKPEPAAGPADEDAAREAGCDDELVIFRTGGVDTRPGLGAGHAQYHPQFPGR